MEIREISFFNEFRCIEGQCSETCCKGWLIPLYPEDVSRYRQEKNILGLKLLIARAGVGRPAINRANGSCPFLNKQGMCSLQLKKGHEFIPEVCRTYPRFYRNYQRFEERHIDLSCIAATRIFLKNWKMAEMIKYDADPVADFTYTNDDFKYLESLYGAKLCIIDELKKVDSFDALKKVCDALIAYSSDAQNAFILGETDFFDNNAFGGYLSVYERGPDKHPAFPFSVTDYSFLLEDTCLYNSKLLLANKTLYDLCMLYYEKYRNEMTYEKIWRDMYGEFMRKYDDLATHFAGYIAYYLHQYFLKCFEDYSFLKNMRIGVMHMNMVFVLSVLLEKDEGRFDTENVARVFSVYNRRAYFNAGIPEDMYEVWNKR